MMMIIFLFGGELGDNFYFFMSRALEIRSLAKNAIAAILFGNREGVPGTR